MKRHKKRNKAEKIKKQTKADFDLPLFPSHSLYTFGAYLDVFGFFQKSLLKVSDTEIRISVFGLPASEFWMRSKKTIDTNKEILKGLSINKRMLE